MIATLLLIHDLHPVSLEQRVQEALDSVRPYMESHGGNVELLSVDDGVARIHLRGSCSDCSASSVTLELAVKRALEEAAPDLAGLEVEGMAPQMPGLGLPMATGTSGDGAADGDVGRLRGLALRWSQHRGPARADLGRARRVAGLGRGDFTGVSVGGGALVVANVEGTLLAYRDRCTGCGAALHDGALTNGALACPSCQRSYFLPRAGRSLDDDGLQLEPVPLLREQQPRQGGAGRLMRARAQVVSGLRALAGNRPGAPAAPPRPRARVDPLDGLGAGTQGALAGRSLARRRRPRGHRALRPVRGGHDP